MRFRRSFEVPPTLIRNVWKLPSLTALVALCLVGFPPTDQVGITSARTQSRSVPGDRLDRRLPMRPGGALRVENPSGSIRVRAETRPEIHLVAVRRGDRNPGAWYSLATSETPAPLVTLEIHAGGTSAIDVEATVPLGVHLQLKTANGSIEVSGPVAAVVAESQTGHIELRLPVDYNADLTLHSTNGTIRSDLATTIFGRFDSHNMQAKLGTGGPPILLRTMAGNVSLLPLESSADAASQRPSYRPVVPVSASRSSRQRPVLRTGREPPKEVPPSPSRPEHSSADDWGEPVRLEAPLVNINASVTDRSGQAITGLTRDDFAVYEDGVRQVISHFAPSTAPFDLVLLLDLSTSTEGKTEVIKWAAERFVDMISPQDRLAVFTFQRHVRVVSDLTNDRYVLKRRIGRIRRVSGGTAFYDALWFTTDELERSPTTRKAIVVLTDGVDNSISNPRILSRLGISDSHSFEVVLERLEESTIIVYPIYLDTEYDMVVRRGRSRAEAYAIARHQLAELAERTAGVLFRADRVEDLEGVYQQVADELRTVYSLAFEPTNSVRDGTWRRIRIKVDHPDAVVRARRGYYAR